MLSKLGGAMPYVIAELGSCHEGQPELRDAMIDSAHISGCNAVKFQFWSDADRMAQRRNVASGSTYYAIYARYAVPPSFVRDGILRAHRLGLDAICSVYLPEDVETITSWGVDALKVASFENEDDVLWRAIRASNPSDVVVSLGMTDVSAVKRWRARRDDARAMQIYLLGCVSEYPARLDGVLRDLVMTPTLNGYSDHTANPLTGAVAVGAGAELLEVHTRDWGTPETNPDFFTALDNAQLNDYVTNARAAWRMVNGTRSDEREMRGFKVRS